MPDVPRVLSWSVESRAITGDDGKIAAVNLRDLPDLIVFLEAARAGSLTSAAKTLHTVQSNVTARVKSLERALGTQLLKRHARGVRLTPAGELVFQLAERTARVLDDLRDAFGHPAAASAAKLRLGAIETVAACHLPALVSGYCRTRPSLDVSVETGSSSALLKQLRGGQLDLAFVSRSCGLPGFREQVAFRDELVIVTPRAIPSLARLAVAGPPLTLLVQRLGCSYTDRLLTYLAATSPRGYRLLEIGTLEGIVRLVAGGLGVAALPRLFASGMATNHGVHLLQLPPALRSLETYVVAPARSQASFAASELFTLCGK
jgi:DNA-binding transcriptional LysR family regulator